MAELFYSVREQYGENWGNEARNKSSRSLLNEVYKKMRQVGLLRGPDETGDVLVLPTAARYSATYEKTAQEPGLHRSPDVVRQTPDASRAKASLNGKMKRSLSDHDTLWSSSRVEEA